MEFFYRPNFVFPAPVSNYPLGKAFAQWKPLKKPEGERKKTQPPLNSGQTGQSHEEAVMRPRYFLDAKISFPAMFSILQKVLP